MVRPAFPLRSLYRMESTSAPGVHRRALSFRVLPAGWWAIHRAVPE